VEADPEVLPARLVASRPWSVCGCALERSPSRYCWPTGWGRGQWTAHPAVHRHKMRAERADSCVRGDFVVARPEPVWAGRTSTNSDIAVPRLSMRGRAGIRSQQPPGSV